MFSQASISSNLHNTYDSIIDAILLPDENQYESWVPSVKPSKPNAWSQIY
jgi:hypothetical protein